MKTLKKFKVLDFEKLLEVNGGYSGSSGGGSSCSQGTGHSSGITSNNPGANWVETPKAGSSSYISTSSGPRYYELRDENGRRYTVNFISEGTWRKINEGKTTYIGISSYAFTSYPKYTRIDVERWEIPHLV